MEVGLHVVSCSRPDAPRSIAPTLAAIAQAAEEAGVSEISFMDHWQHGHSAAVRRPGRVHPPSGD